ncbi:MAG: TetR/AcrR family transcriptional regulator [Kiritimatiellae bacterium]|nr:TetR/AcrR family transcriptional regulator [Kiritimatiellia bacterium]
MENNEIVGGSETESSESTRNRILHAATQVFAERGFRDATTRMICNQAGVNVALVNYHFHSKSNLYRECVLNIFRQNASSLKSAPQPVTDSASWKDAIRRWVHWVLKLCAAEEPPLSYLARLLGHEASMPPELGEEFHQKVELPFKDRMMSLLKMALPDPSPALLNLWFSSILSQCVIYALEKPGWRLKYCPDVISLPEWLDMVSDHICESVFSRLDYRGTQP